MCSHVRASIMRYGTGLHSASAAATQPASASRLPLPFHCFARIKSMHMSSSIADEMKMECSCDTHPPIVRSLDPLYADVAQAQARSESHAAAVTDAFAFEDAMLTTRR